MGAKVLRLYFCCITSLVYGFLADLCWLLNVTYVCKNLQTPLKEPEMVNELLAKEVKKGY